MVMSRTFAGPSRAGHNARSATASTRARRRECDRRSKLHRAAVPSIIARFVMTLRPRADESLRLKTIADAAMSDLIPRRCEHSGGVIGCG